MNSQGSFSFSLDEQQQHNTNQGYPTNFDDIPEFANFDNGHEKTTPAHVSSMNKKAGASKGRSVNFDSVAAADHKWAKEQASRMAKYQASVINNNGPSKTVHRPSVGGLLRSESLGNIKSNFVDIQKSADPVDVTEKYGRAPKSRTRSMSPVPTTNKKSTKKDGPNSLKISSKRSISVPQSKKRLKDEEAKLEKFYASKNFTFQSIDKLVSLRTVDISSRIAFEKKRFVSVEELYEVVAKGNIERLPKDELSKRMSKLSPSVQHVELLNIISNIRSIRQLCWSPRLNENADPFHGWEDYFIKEPRSFDDSDERSIRKRQLLEEKRLKMITKRGSRYKPMDCLGYIQSTLPDYEPLLTNIRRRLPRRSDVGFPNASKEEIESKQAEIAKEAKLEEISPRLVVLLSSDDVGTPLDAITDKSTLPFASSALLDAKSITPKSLVRSNQENNKFAWVSRPDKFSFFAPPIDATPSSHFIWKNRPFYDQSPGLKNVIVTPLDVRFDVGAIEPLVCTLSLYCLPPKSALKDDTYRGKISEDFVFHSGDWKNLIGKVEHEIITQPNHPKLAIFTYDPIALETTDEQSYGEQYLFLLLQVHKVLQFGAHGVYLDESNSSARKGFFNSMTKNVSSQDLARDCSEIILQEYGTKFLTPFCFGLVPLLPNFNRADSDKICWPNGDLQSMQLFSHNDDVESDSYFLDRITSIAQKYYRSFDLTDDSDTGSLGSFDIQDVTAKKSGGHNILRRRRNSKTVFARARPSFSYDDLKGSKATSGTATFHNSWLGANFIESLLVPPNFSKLDFSVDPPKVLVDHSGDSAIMVNPEQGNLKLRKRSDLFRLKTSPTAGGYIASSEIRQILYMPPACCRIQQVPQQLSPLTPINLLYIYPSMLKTIEIQNGDDSPKDLCYSIRVRLVRQSLENSESTYSPEPAIYNSVILGEPLVTEVYTKIPLYATHYRSLKPPDLPLRDEIKIRLPSILDGTHHLQFTLFSIRVRSASNYQKGLEEKVVSEAFVPLSSSTHKESLLGTRISTVIPNGLHRIKLSPFQFHLHSKIISNIHVGDPAVAAILREFPSGMQKDVTSYSKVLASASDQAILDHINPLIFLYLRALMKSDRFLFTDVVSGVSDSLYPLEVLCGLCEIISKVKIALNDVKQKKSTALKRILKEIIDNFDERMFSPDGKTIQPIVEDDFSEQSNDENDYKTDNTPSSTRHVQFNNTSSPRKALKGQSKASKRRRKYVDNFYASLDTNSPMNRKAFGVTKIDRLKADAEMYDSDNFLSELVDDEETVVTATTWQSNFYKTPTVQSSETNTGGSKSYHVTISTNNSRSSKTMTPLERAKDMAVRFNSVAKTFVAPCVLPDFLGENIGIIDTQSRSSTVLSQDRRVETLKSIFEVDKPHDAYESAFKAGSDDELDDMNINLRFRKKNEAIAPRGIFKKDVLVKLSFSSGSPQKSSYLYEIITSVWLNALLAAKLINQDAQEKHLLAATAFVSNMDFLLPLCLKSLVLRLSEKVPSIELLPSSFLDTEHFKLLISLSTEILEHLILTVVANIRDGEFDCKLDSVLSQSDTLINFILGLFGVIHPEQVSKIIFNYLETIQKAEKSYSLNNVASEDPYSYCGFSSCCRQLSLRLMERVSSLPNFVALNFPYKYNGKCPAQKVISSSWAKQNASIDSSVGISDDLQPSRHWLAKLVIEECLTVTQNTCETVLYGRVIFRRTNSNQRKQLQSAFGKKKLQLPRDLVTQEEIISYHAVSIVYDIVIRRNALDSRFQSNEALERIAATILSPLLHCTVQAVHVLADLDASHKVRNQWLLCILYILQEAPEVALRQSFSVLCDHEEGDNVVKFVKVLGLCASSSQLFISSDFTPQMGPWLLQESFNTISAATILIVDECILRLSNFSSEFQRASESLISLLLKIICAPLPSVTLLRALGAASHVLESIGSACFMAAVGSDIQHWGRMIFSHMNSTSLSVRSMAVDLIVSLFGSIYKDGGYLDEIGQIFASVLSEVAAREIALYCQFGQVNSIECVEKCIWPLRRALTDIEDADPNDDDRVDISMIPFLKLFCRACQAIIDGVLIELRLQVNDCKILDTKISIGSGRLTSYYEKGPFIPLKWQFDADEESLFEAADFFTPEASPIQRIRWLLTLKKLHCLKGQWIEAAEALLLSAKTVADAIPHMKHIWRPSRFGVWQNVQGNAKRVFEFADEFLEPYSMRSQLHMDIDVKGSDHDETLPPLNTVAMCSFLITLCKEAVEMYKNESTVVSLAYNRLQGVLKILMNVVDNHSLFSSGIQKRNVRLSRHISRSGEMAALRRVSATLHEMVTKVGERAYLLERANDAPAFPSVNTSGTKPSAMDKTGLFVRVILMGKKTPRFNESTGVPTFLDWDTPHICRISRTTIQKTLNSCKTDIEYALCRNFAEPLLLALSDEVSSEKVIFATGIPHQSQINIEKTYIVVSLVHSLTGSADEVQCKKFKMHGGMELNQQHLHDRMHSLVFEMSVVRPFPCPLSRQPVLVTNEYHITQATEI